MLAEKFCDTFANLTHPKEGWVIHSDFTRTSVAKEALGKLGADLSFL